MHEHPCAPQFNPCSQLRSCISEGIRHQPHLPATPLQFWASNCVRWSHLAVLPPPERKQHPGSAQRRGNVPQPGCQPAPRASGKPGLRTPPAAWGGNARAQESPHLWVSGSLGTSVTHEAEEAGGWDCRSSREKKMYTQGRARAWKSKRIFNLSWGPNEMSETG